MGETLLSRLAQFFGTNKKRLKKHNRKYEFLIKIINDKSYRTAIVVDGGGTSLSTILNKILWIRNSWVIYRLISCIEIYIWCWLNGINPFQQTIIFHKSKLDEKSDILFSFAFFADFFLNGKFIDKSIIKNFNGKKILHATHFYKSTKVVAENVRKVGVKYMVAEANLKKSSYFNTFFDFIDQVYVLPHVLRERYTKTTDFDGRKNLCLALGTLVIESELDKSNEDYLNFFKINTLHPMRKEIFENKENLSNLVDCFIDFHSGKRLSITNKSSLYRKNNIFKLLYDLFFLSEGKEYHSMDIVKKFNEYKMFIAPEETIGLPSVNVVEGMACGCAYIGLNHSMYRDIGMIAGKHFIAYNGTTKDLADKIAHYQRYPVELQKIAECGYMFVKKNFYEKKVTDNFWNFLEGLVAK